jgi:hypothetical protein
MHDLVSAVFKKCAEHHEKYAEHHAAVRTIHKERAQHLEDAEGDPIGGRQHRLIADHHGHLAKTHRAHAEVFGKCAKEIDVRSGGADGGTKAVEPLDLRK